VLHECGRLTIREESLNYSFAGLTGTFGKHRITPERARELCRMDGRGANQEEIANCVYGGEWGRKNLGNTEPGDGWRYRGRGLIQITGRNNYTKRGQLLGIDLAGQPELVVDPRFALEIAAAFWKSAGCNELADRSDDARAVTKAVNGGDTGLPEREELLRLTRRTWPWA
jgi:putative chitinase